MAVDAMDVQHRAVLDLLSAKQESRKALEMNDDNHVEAFQSTIAVAMNFDI